MCTSISILINWVTRALAIAFSKYPNGVKLVFIIAVGGKEWEMITANPKWSGKFASEKVSKPVRCRFLFLWSFAEDD
jgi:hypothetical protein